MIPARSERQFDIHLGSENWRAKALVDRSDHQADADCPGSS